MEEVANCVARFDNEDLVHQAGILRRYCYLNGQRPPRARSRDTFDILKVRVRVYMCRYIYVAASILPRVAVWRKSHLVCAQLGE